MSHMSTPAQVLHWSLKWDKLQLKLHEVRNSEFREDPNILTLEDFDAGAEWVFHDK